MSLEMSLAAKDLPGILKESSGGLSDTAVDLCKADTAGVSLLEGDVFRWEAVAGVFASARGGTMPRTKVPAASASTVTPCNDAFRAIDVPPFWLTHDSQKRSSSHSIINGKPIAPSGR